MDRSLPSASGLRLHAFVPLDTSLEAFEVQIEALRRLGPEGRLAQVWALNRATAELCEAGIRRRHPDYDARSVFLARVRLELGDELFRAVYPDAPRLAP